MQNCSLVLTYYSKNMKLSIFLGLFGISKVFGGSFGSTRNLKQTDQFNQSEYLIQEEYQAAHTGYNILLYTLYLSD